MHLKEVIAVFICYCVHVGGQPCRSMRIDCSLLVNCVQTLVCASLLQIYASACSLEFTSEQKTSYTVMVRLEQVLSLSLAPFNGFLLKGGIDSSCCGLQMLLHNGGSYRNVAFFSNA